MASDQCSCYGRCNHDIIAPVEVEVQTADGGFHPPDEPQFRHLIRDLWGGVEEDRFEMETPRVHVTQDDFDKVTVSKTHGEPGLRQTIGPPLLELDFEWCGLDGDLYADLHDYCGSGDSPVILYGDNHFWTVTHPWSIDMSMEVAPDGPLTCEAQLQYRGFEHAGWR